MEPYTKPITKPIVDFAEPTFSTEEKKRFSKKTLPGWRINFPPLEGVMIRIWELAFTFSFLTPKYIFSNLNTVNLKMFQKNGGIYRFKRKLNKNYRER